MTVRSPLQHNLIIPTNDLSKVASLMVDPFSFWVGFGNLPNSYEVWTLYKNHKKNKKNQNSSIVLFIIWTQKTHKSQTVMNANHGHFG